MKHRVTLFYLQQNNIVQKYVPIMAFNYFKIFSLNFNFLENQNYKYLISM